MSKVRLPRQYFRFCTARTLNEPDALIHYGRSPAVFMKDQRGFWIRKEWHVPTRRHGALRVAARTCAPEFILE